MADILTDAIMAFREQNQVTRGASITVDDDGSVEIDLNPPKVKDKAKDKAHFKNLAEDMGDMELGVLADELIRDIEIDDDSRKEWLNTRAQAIDLLGVKIKAPKSDPGGSGAPLEGMSTVQSTLLLEAVLRYQATARGEILPSGGPVKVTDWGTESMASDGLAEALERDMNFYLTSTATEYVPDTDRMLFMQGLGGLGIKKVYNCPLRQRPVSETVDPEDFIVSNAATDLRNASRITHRIMMRPSDVKRMQLLGVYRSVYLGASNPEKTVVDLKKESVIGIKSDTFANPDQNDREIYECYCELDLPGYEHEQDGEATGLKLPYRVTLDKTARQVLAICRNWDSDDTEYQPKRFFVLFPFVPAFGIYALGLLHILGNLTRAITAGTRELLDAGMFACFPGFLYSKQAGRQISNEFRIAPGSGVGLDTNGQPIGNMVMNLPYKEPSQTLVKLMEMLESGGQRLGAMSEQQTGDGRADVPVGTMLAMIEQSQKVLDAVHKRTHQAQSEEFQLLKERFRDDPEAFWRHSKKTAAQWDQAKFMQALDRWDLVPVADPNTPSHVHRLMKATAIKQLQGSNPSLYDAVKVDTMILNMLGVADPESLFAAPQAPPPDPRAIAAQADNQIKAQSNQIKVLDIQTKAQSAEKDRQSKAQLEALKTARESVIHPESAGLADRTMTDPIFSRFLQ